MKEKPRTRQPGSAGFWLLLGILLLADATLAAETCPGTSMTPKQVFWGDLHVHTAYSLDAYAFGATSSPKDAYAFARGQNLTLSNGKKVAIDRPLDFAAVTDHAESYDIMYLCTDPLYRNETYCRTMREWRDTRAARRLFADVLLPIVTGGKTPPLCAEQDIDCNAARMSQWYRTQQAANEANDPCDFTALIGYEWSASPEDRHWHRNVIFRSAQVPGQVIDYVRYPSVGQLWAALDQTCRPQDDCDVLTIPHNLNWSDGGGFGVETETPATRSLRARFERLAEIHQEKGNSECLPADPADRGEDCAFERTLPRFTTRGADGRVSDADWEALRSGHYRTLLGRGLLAFASTGSETNPLMLGAIGSTDNHFGTAGDVSESGFFGGIAMLWQDDATRLTAPVFNPGGLVAVWAEQNTRASIFDALQRREAYATSGPRITVRFGVANGEYCGSNDVSFATPMGGILRSGSTPVFTVLAAQDQTRLAAVEIVKGVVVNGAVQERATPPRPPTGMRGFWSNPRRAGRSCSASVRTIATSIPRPTG